MRCGTLMAGGSLLGMAMLIGAGSAQEPKLVISRVDQDIVDRTNEMRARQKLSILKPHPILFDNARFHAKNLSRVRKFVHVIDGKGPDNRAEEAGYDWAVIKENVGFFLAVSGKTVIVDGFMTSPQHRENLLGKDYEDIGIGIYPGYGPDNMANLKGYWVAQVFGKLRKKQ
jgi:uncharacterized protein YkwD